MRLYPLKLKKYSWFDISSITINTIFSSMNYKESHIFLISTLEAMSSFNVLRMQICFLTYPFKMFKI